MPKNATINAHLVLLQPEAEQRPLPAHFMKRMSNNDSRAASKADHFNIDAMSHAMMRRNNRHVGGISGMQFAKAFKQLSNYQELLQMMPAEKILAVINLPIFRESLVKNSSPTVNLYDPNSSFDTDFLELIDNAYFRWIDVRDGKGNYSCR